MKFPKVSIPALVGGTFLLMASQIFAQSSGTSHPEALDDSISVVAPQNSTVTVTPPAPVVRQSVPEEVYVAPAPPRQTAEVLHPRLVAPASDPDDGIATAPPYDPNALVEGTLLKARLVGSLSTEETKPGSHFIATLTENVSHDGRVILPVGASLEGRVTEARGGRRIGGGSALHLEPETVTLPDGTLYRLTARVIDVDAGHTHVNDEGTITGGNHTKAHVTTLAATTGTGAVAGAVVGGGVGAVVGASIGAGVGSVLWLNQDRQQTLDDGTLLVFSLNRPMGLTPTAPTHR